MPDKQVKVKTDVAGYMNDLILILTALGKHLEVIDNMELSALDRFTISGLALAVGGQQQKIMKKMEEWGIFELPK